MDAVAGALDFAGAALDLAVFEADLHERGRLDLGPMHAERDLVIAVAAARHDERQVVENALAETVPVGDPVRGRKIDARLTLLGAAVLEQRR